MTAHRAYRIAALLVLAATSAAAEPPRIGVLAGLGARQEWGPGPALITYHPDGPGPRPALHATVTIAFSPHLAFGAHAAATKATYRDVLRDCYTLISTDLAIALAYVYPRFTVAPWLGRHLSRVNSIGDYACEPHAPLRAYWANAFTSYGITATVDVFTRADHHLAVFVDAQTGTVGGHPSYERFNYSAVTAGLAYRR